MARRGKRSALDRALFHMKPNRIAARALSGGRHQTFGAIAKSPFKSKTVHTGKSGRRAYQQRMAKERKARAAEAAKQRKQAAADLKAARAQMRAQQPRAQRPRQNPIAVNPRTGKPITWAQAQAGMRQAQREVERIERGDAPKAPRKRASKATAKPKTPLQAAIDEVKKNQPKQRPSAKPKPAAKKTTKSRSRRRVQPLAPVLAGTPAPKVQRPGRTLTGVAMAATCQCQGTGRIVVMDAQGNPHGSTSCPTHGRSGKSRGSKKWTMRGAIRESGLPGLAARLERKRTARFGDTDERQSKAHKQAAKQVRHAGPTRKCGQCENSSGIAEKPLVDRLRVQYIRELRAEFEAQIRMAVAHNAEVDATGEGRKVKVPKMPSDEKLRGMVRRKYPYDFCSACKGLGRVASSVNAPGAQEAQFPVAEWRANAKLRKGHLLTGRERATGKRMSENAARVERNQKLPRF